MLATMAIMFAPSGFAIGAGKPDQYQADDEKTVNREHVCSLLKERLNDVIKALGEKETEKTEDTLSGVMGDLFSGSRKNKTIVTSFNELGNTFMSTAKSIYELYSFYNQRRNEYERKFNNKTLTEEDLRDLTNLINQDPQINRFFTDDSFRKNILVLIVPQIDPKKVNHPNEIKELLSILVRAIEKSPTLSGSKEFIVKELQDYARKRYMKTGGDLSTFGLSQTR